MWPNAPEGHIWQLCGSVIIYIVRSLDTLVQNERTYIAVTSSGSRGIDGIKYSAINSVDVEDVDGC